MPGNAVREMRNARGRDKVASMTNETQQLPDPLICIDPNRLGGMACFAGTRVPVKTLFDYIEAGDPLSEFLVDFPNVTRDHAVAVLELARTSALEFVQQRQTAAE